MTIERSVRLIAGAFVLISLALLVSVHRLCRAESVSVGLHQLVSHDDIPAQVWR
jgi:hypothetical protein